MDTRTLTALILTHPEVSSAVRHSEPIRGIVTHFISDTVTVTTLLSHAPHRPASDAQWKRVWNTAAKLFVSDIAVKALTLRAQASLRKHHISTSAVEFEKVAQNTTILTWLILADIPPKDFYGR